ncbi:MAG TPA: 6-bladed beta-propeller, partial [Terriglobales bacterium]|nr:6-bladed beta-propeller [Terriglobales bacterium]
TPRPTLDGMAYLRQRAPYELAAFDWLNERVQGIPVILEAHGDSYQEFTRVSMNTGLPTVLGWAYHVFQRAHPWPEINLRKADIETAYTSDNKEVVAAILERYHVALVFVGSLERRTYAGGNLERFKEWTDILSPVYQNEAVTIFAVKGRFRGAMPVSTIEDIAPVDGITAAQVQDAPGRLQQPRGIGVSSQGEIYVADFGNHRVQQFDKELKHVRHWGKMGDLPGEFKEPCGLEVAPSGEVLVADTWNHRVQQFAPDGKYLREWSVSFYGPRGVAAAPDGRIYVTDTGNNRVHRFSSEGRHERTWGKPGSEVGSFTEPMGITVDSENIVYVCDNGNSRLQAFTSDGQPLFQFRVEGWESKVYSEPDVTIDPEQRIWVTVPGAREIRAYDRSGNVLATIKHRSPADVVLDTPMSIAFDASSGTLVVSDLSGRIVRIRRP